MFLPLAVCHTGVPFYKLRIYLSQARGARGVRVVQRDLAEQRAEQHVSGEVLSVRVQGERREASPPLTLL